MTEESPIVSVVIPCYNHGDFLGVSIESVLNQTFKQYEIIVVDDGSNDGPTKNALDRSKHPKIHVLRTENQGLASARNNGIRAARGRYILPLDADDKIAPDYIRQAVAVLDQKKEYGIVYCNAEFFGNQSGPWKLPSFTLDRMLLGNIIFYCALFRKDDWAKVGGYNKNMKDGWEDWDFWLSLLEQNIRPYRLSDTLYYYRRAEGSMVEKLHQAGRDSFMTMQVMINHRGFYGRKKTVTANRITAVVWGQFTMSF